MAWPVAVLCLYTVVALGVARYTLPTADEPKYLDVGRYLTSTWEWDAKSTVVHAPLSFYTHGLLLKPFQFPDDRARLLTARTVMLLYAWGLGLAIYAWARTRHGPRAGLLALVLWAALPDTLGHGPLITTDIILACWVTWCAFALWRWFATGRWRWAMVGGVALGAALLSKYTAGIWIVSTVALGLLAAWAARGEGSAGPRRVLAGVAVLLAVAYVVFCSGYGWRGVLDQWGQHAWASAKLRGLAEHPLLAGAPLVGPLPWWQGVDYVMAASEVGHPGFLLGERFTFAPWYYQPVCFLLKVPAPFLVLLLLLGPATRRVPRSDWLGAACLLGPPALLVANLMFANRIAAGFRYSYPLLPALCIVLGRFGSPRARMLPQVRGGVRTLVALCVVTAAWNYPHYLAYVNLFAGSPAHAYKFFADSTLDWAQEPLPAEVMAAARRGDVAINPGPIPVTSRIVANVNTYHDVFTRGRPHGWLAQLPVVMVHNRVWLELDGREAAATAPPLLGALAREEWDTALQLLQDDVEVSLDARIAAYRALALDSVVQGRLAEGRERLWIARGLDLAQAHQLPASIAFGECPPLGEPDETDPVWWNNAGVSSYLAGQPVRAAAQFREAIRVQPWFPASYANLAIALAQHGAWEEALEIQRTHDAIVVTTKAQPFIGYRVYYGRQRIMFGRAWELWPRYTVAQLGAAVQWASRPTADAAAALVRALAADTRLVEAGIVLREVEARWPTDRAVEEAGAEWNAAVTRLRREGRVSE